MQVKAKQTKALDVSSGDTLILYTENLGQPYRVQVQQVKHYQRGTPHHKVEWYLSGRVEDPRWWPPLDAPYMVEVTS